MKKLPFSILKRLNKIFRPEYSVVRRGGVRMLLNKNNWIDNRLLCFRGYEKKNLSFLLKTLKEEDFNRFLDIGANIGYFTVHAAVKTKVPNIMCFEPMSKNYYQLCGNVLINKVTERVTPVRMALSDKTETSEIFYDENSTGIGTLRPDENVRSRKDYNRSEKIECARFDDLYKIHGEKIFIKMDVEQFELNVLRGMTEFLKQNEIWMMIEINDQDGALSEFLKSHGFTLKQADIDDYLYKNVQA